MRYPPHTIDKYQTIGVDRGITWIGDSLPPNSRTKTLWRDAKGHDFEATYNDIQQGQVGCRQCGHDYAISQQRTAIEAHIQKLADRNIALMTDTVDNVRTVVPFKCMTCDHEWRTTIDSILGSQKTGCPECAKLIRAAKKRLPISDYINAAKHRGIEWIGKEHPGRADVKTRWRCQCGYEWSTRLSVIRRGDGCPKCSGMARLTEADYHDLADRRGIAWIGRDLPKNNETKTAWLCPCGHAWETAYGKINSGRTGCPICKESTGEKTIRLFLERQGIEFERQKTFPGLRGQLRGRLKYDFFIPSLNFLIEYHGIQHTEPINQFGGNEALQSVKERDRIKQQWAKDNGYILAVIYCTTKDIETVLLRYINQIKAGSGVKLFISTI